MQIIAISSMLAIGHLAMAQGTGRVIDPLSSKSPAFQERAQYSTRKGGSQKPQGGIASSPPNDDCENATAVFDGITQFSTVGATTDGPTHAKCLYNGDNQISHDVWFEYTAKESVSKSFFVCSTQFDSKLAVYEGCVCPFTDANLINCKDDSCSSSGHIIVPVIAGNCYKIRVGGFGSEVGAGTLFVFPYVPPPPAVCGVGNDHDCCTPGNPGCNDLACCTVVCGIDPFCCDTTWDDRCVKLANQECNWDGGPGQYCPWACGPNNPQSCFESGPLPGCNIQKCCDAICSIDPYCCQVSWDETCVQYTQIGLCEPSACVVECKPGARFEQERCGYPSNDGCNAPKCFGPFQDCCTATGVPGCTDPTCQESVCAVDPFCCNTAWDEICAGEACQDAQCQCVIIDIFFPWEDVECGDTICGTFWSSTVLRDTDWYRFTTTVCGTLVTWNVMAEFPPAVFLISGDCPGRIVGMASGSCETGGWTASAELAVGTYYAFIAPSAFVELPCGSLINDYTGTLTCEVPCVGDINGPGGPPNGVVDVDDLLKVINNWGVCK